MILRLDENERIEILMMISYSSRIRTQKISHLFIIVDPWRQISRSTVSTKFFKFKQFVQVQDIKPSGRPYVPEETEVTKKIIRDRKKIVHKFRCWKKHCFKDFPESWVPSVQATGNA